MPLSTERRGELAILVLRKKLRRDGFTLKDRGNIRRDLHNEARDLNVPIEELAEFVLFMTEQIYGDTSAELRSIANQDELLKEKK
jgi:hypothetical protein